MTNKNFNLILIASMVSENCVSMSVCGRLNTASYLA